jgi:23S rRNA (cytosine1962-C5)-methyltransferase
VLSAEVFAGAMRPRVDDLLKRLGERLGTEHTMVKAAPESQGREGFDFEPYASPGCPKQVVVREFGTRFRVRFSGGHKTGFFCDQRDNRRKLAEFTEGRSVLDVCCYTGGFAVQAATLGKAADVTAIDLDEEAIAVAKENANLNQARIRFAHSDAFGWMRDALRQGRMWDVVVLDPPKLIRSRAEYEEGHRKHHDLNRLAISLVRPGGLLLTCTCAGLMDRDEFQRVVHAAARRAEKAGSGAEVEATSFLEGDDGPAAFSPRIRGRSLRIFDVTAAAADHPVSPECPETRYLSAIWAQVGE